MEGIWYMKKFDTFYLSEKQTAQMKKAKKTRINKRVMIAILLLVISNVCGILLNYIQNPTAKLILTGIVGFGGLGSVIVFASV